MDKNKSKTETKTSPKDEANPSPTEKWDSRLGDWTPIDDSTNSQLPTYSRLLTKVGTVFIIREFRLFNVETDGNRYLIKDHVANNLFYGIETNNSSAKMCVCAANRAFNLTFFGKNKEPALRLYRPFRMGCCGIIPCFRQKIQIKDNLDKHLGEVTQRFNLCRFSLKLKSTESELQIYGPTCQLRLSYCLDDICFNIYDKSDATKNYEISCGHICKLSEFNSGGHIFRVKFGKDWSPEMKSVVIGATILIDYYFFDNTYHESKYHSLTMSSAPQTLAPFPLLIRYQEDSNSDQTLDNN